MSALNETFSDREVLQMWRVNVALWEREQYDDDDAMEARHETDILRRADARYPFGASIGSMQYDPDYDDDWRDR